MYTHYILPAKAQVGAFKHATSPPYIHARIFSNASVLHDTIWEIVRLSFALLQFRDGR